MASTAEIEPLLTAGEGGSFYLDRALLYEVTALVDSPGLLVCESSVCL